MAQIQKISPIAALYRKWRAKTINISDWEIASNFGHPDKEKQALLEGSVIADWSHIGKIVIRGASAPNEADNILNNSSTLEVGETLNQSGLAAGRLTDDEYITITAPGEESKYITNELSDTVSVVNMTGAMGCFALAGPRREEVLERSSAMNLFLDNISAGRVVQTTIHVVHCIIFRTEKVDLFIHDRGLSQSLLEALIDVGQGVGLVATGIDIVPVDFSLNSEVDA